MLHKLLWTDTRSCGMDVLDLFYPVLTTPAGCLTNLPVEGDQFILYLQWLKSLCLGTYSKFYLEDYVLSTINQL